MRSAKIHRALAQGMNRFEVCQIVSKGVKAIHKTGSRFEDSINDVLQYMGTHDMHRENLHSTMPQLDAQVAVKILEPAA
jgi:uncharacterized protein YoaH (UPF0181 family)